MKVLFLAVGPDNVASSRGRVYQFLGYLREANITTKVIPFTSRKAAHKAINNIRLGFAEKTLERMYNIASFVKVAFLCRGFDAIFIQKTCLPVTFFALIKRLNDNIVFDFDDAIFDSKVNPGTRRLKRFGFTLKNCKHVIAGNAYLKERAIDLNDKVSVIITPVDTDRLFPNGENRVLKKEVVIGWIGSPDTCGYLHDLRGVFQTLISRYDGVRFEFVGADAFYKGLSGFTIKEWSFARESEDLRNFDIGVMPLNNNEWSRGKCGYKLLQYMAVGIPCVASPTGVNTELVKNGVNGFLAGSEDEWIEKLSILNEDDNLRIRMGLEGRKRAEVAYSYNVIAPRLIDCLKEISA